MLQIKKLFPQRKPDSNKGDFGRTLIVAGSSGMLGAAILASRGALRVGSGLTYLAVPKELKNFANLATPEIITLSFAEINKVKYTAAAIGPGLSLTGNISKLLNSLTPNPYPLVIDASALDFFVPSKKARAPLILTPHPGEMARLIGKSVEFIQDHRTQIAIDTAKRLGCVIVLKGAKTVIASPDGKLYINSTGNPGMAKGGAGDVLCGMIAGLAAQGHSPWDCAVAGVYLHGLAGDLAVKIKGEYALTASDLTEKIADALNRSR